MAEETDLGSLSGDFPKELTHYLLVAFGEPLSEDFIEPALAEIEKGEWYSACRWDAVLELLQPADAQSVRISMVYLRWRR